MTHTALPWEYSAWAASISGRRPVTCLRVQSAAYEEDRVANGVPFNRCKGIFQK